MKKLLLFPLLCLILALPGKELLSHPHVKITSHITFHCDNGKCRSLEVEWTFDDYFSASVIQECDADKNGSFNKAEIDMVYNNAFENLKHYGYFIFLRKGNTRINPQKVENFSAKIKDKHTLIYSFTVTLPDESWGDDFYVSVFDRTFYCATYYHEKAATIDQKDDSKLAVTQEVNKKFPVYYNPLGTADDMTIYTEMKPGLETAYPEELHLFTK